MKRIGNIKSKIRVLQIDKCPFCGGKASVYTDVYYGLAEAFSVYCTSCNAETRMFNSKDEAINAWNARFSDSEIESNV